MNEEENQAVEKLKQIKEHTIEANKCGLSNNDFKEEIEVYDTVLNLITKLQKENDELKAKLEFKKYGDLDDIEFEEYIEKLKYEELEIENKIINKMAELLMGMPVYDNEEDDIIILGKIDKVKEYFRKKVKDEVI